VSGKGREGAALSHSPGVFAQGNSILFFGIHAHGIRGYHRRTVQPGAAMTVKEMRPLCFSVQRPFSVPRNRLCEKLLI